MGCWRVALGVVVLPKYRHGNAHIQGACCVVPGGGRQTLWSSSHDENMFFFYKEDLLTYKNLQKYATKYIHIYNMKYNKMAA